MYLMAPSCRKSAGRSPASTVTPTSTRTGYVAVAAATGRFVDRNERGFQAVFIKMTMRRHQSCTNCKPLITALPRFVTP